MASFTDDFNRADGALGANWVSTTNAGPLKVASNQVIGGSSVTAARWATAASTGTVFSQATYLYGGQVGVAVAMSAFSGVQVVNAGSWYWFGQRSLGAGYAISQKGAGINGSTALATSATNLAANDVIRIKYDGTTLTAMVNGTTVLTHAPTSPLTNQPHQGLAVNTATYDGLALYDNWSGGDVETGLGVPSGLTATPISSTQIDLAWNAVSGATGYDIERDGTIIVTDHATTTYSDTGRAASTLYSYRVRTVVV